MIGLEQWRCVIGLFMFKSVRGKPVSKNKNNNNNSCGRTYDDLSDLCCRLFIMSFTFWLFHFAHQGISFVLSSSNCFNFDLLMQSGDIESHPGPGQENKALEDLLKQFSAEITEQLSSQIQSVRTDLKNEISSVRESVVSLKNELKCINERVQSVEDEQNIHRSDLIACGETMSKLEDRITSLEESTERQAQYSRRENVILHGIAEEQQSEDYDKMRKKVTQLLNNNVKSKTWQESDILRAHRLGDPSSKKIRPVIVRFAQFHDKLSVLKSRDDLKKCAIGVANDLTKFQRDQLSKLRERNETGYYKNGKLHIVENKTGSSHDRQKGSGVSKER